jgi:hypothetical protein
VALRTVPSEASPPAIDCAAFGIPRLGERLSGDAAVIERRDGHVFVAIIDVLGHGAKASVVASRAASFLGRSWSLDLSDTIVRLDKELHGSRGAVAGLCAIDEASGASRFSGIGDTGIYVAGIDHPGLYSREGILGSRIRTPRVQRFQLDRGGIIVLHTDGVTTSFRADVRAGKRTTAAQLARQIVQAYRRPQDDATCIVALVGETTHD